MAYEKQNFVDGEVLTAAQLNRIEDGIVAIEESYEQAVEEAVTEAVESGDFKGEKGDPGDKGERGGPGYTPVKGVDYWTEADKDEIKSYVGVGQKADAIVCTAQGETIFVTDSSDNSIRGLKIFGKTTQDGTPTPDNPVELVSVGNSGTINAAVTGKNLCNAKAVFNGTYNISVETSDDGYTIVSVGGTKNWSNSQINIDTTLLKGKTVYLKADSIDITQQYRSGVIPVLINLSGTTYPNSLTTSTLKSSFEIPEDNVRLELRICTNNTADAHDVDNTITVKGLTLSLNDYAEWEQYKETQTLAVSTPNGLSGIPVVNGGNYTDANGQQWICDEIDFARGVHIQRVKRFELAVADMNNLEEYPGWTNVDGLRECTEHLTGIPNINWPRLINIGSYVNVNLNGTNEILFLNNTANGGKSQSEWKANYPDLIVDIMLPLSKAVETALSPEEIAAFKALHTNKPSTVVYNDSGAYMQLEYNADTKTYIDNKFAELATAIVNNA